MNLADISQIYLASFKPIIVRDGFKKLGSRKIVF